MRSATVKQDIDSLTADRALFDPMKGSGVLITGATGLIGSMLVRALHEANVRYGLGIRVIASVRDVEKAGRMFGDIMDGGDISITLVCDADCSFIIHTASPTRSKYFITNPVETIKTSVLGTVEILDLAVKNGASVVYLSSMEQYGVPYVPGEVMTEDKTGVIDHLSVRSCYSESKRLCECLCVSYASEYGTDVKIARLGQTFGAGAPLSDNRMPMQFANAVVSGTDIVLHTEGRSISNCIYLTDALSGILTVLLKGRRGEAYNVSNDEEIKSVRQIAETVAEQVAGGKISVRVEIPEEQTGYAPDVNMYLNTDKLRSLGWKPAHSLADSYARLAEYIRETAEDVQPVR